MLLCVNRAVIRLVTCSMCCVGVQKAVCVEVRAVIIKLITCSMCCVGVQKEEAGDVRHEVDFEQLKIENKQYNEHYEGKNQELLRLKLSAGNTLQVLNAYKVRRRNIFRQTFMCTHTDSYVAEKASYLELGVVHAHIGDEAQERTAGED